MKYFIALFYIYIRQLKEIISEGNNEIVSCLQLTENHDTTLLLLNIARKALPSFFSQKIEAQCDFKL